MRTDICSVCAEEFEHEYAFKRLFCSDDCKDKERKKKASEAKLSEGLFRECPQCHHQWRPRSPSFTYCPKCQYGKFKRIDLETTSEPITLELCHHCAKLRDSRKNFCTSCRKPVARGSHYLGITTGNWQKIVRFLQEYILDDPYILGVKDAVLNSIPSLPPTIIKETLSAEDAIAELTAEPVAATEEEIELSEEEARREIEGLFA